MNVGRTGIPRTWGVFVAADEVFHWFGLTAVLVTIWIAHEVVVSANVLGTRGYHVHVAVVHIAVIHVAVVNVAVVHVAVAHVGAIRIAVINVAVIHIAIVHVVRVYIAGVYVTISRMAHAVCLHLDVLAHSVLIAVPTVLPVTNIMRSRPVVAGVVYHHLTTRAEHHILVLDLVVGNHLTIWCHLTI